jgi:hypothetical protein
MNAVGAVAAAADAMAIAAGEAADQGLEIITRIQAELDGEFLEPPPLETAEDVMEVIQLLLRIISELMYVLGLQLAVLGYHLAELGLLKMEMVLLYVVGYVFLLRYSFLRCYTRIYI